MKGYDHQTWSEMQRDAMPDEGEQAREEAYKKGQEDLLNEMVENTPIDADEWLREILRTAQRKSITLKQSI